MSALLESLLTREQRAQCVDAEALQAVVSIRRLLALRNANRDAPIARYHARRWISALRVLRAAGATY